MKHFNKVYGSISLLMALFFSFLAGLAASHRWYQAMSVDLTVVVAWVTFGLIAFAQYVHDVRWGEKSKALEIVEKALNTLKESKELVKIAESAVDKAMEAIDTASKESPQEAHAREMTELMAKIIDEVTGGGRPPKGAEITKAKKLFHERTGDHYAKIHGNGSEEVTIEIHNHPFKSTKRAPRKPTTPVVSKSEQRRLAAIKKSEPTPAKKG